MDKLCTCVNGCLLNSFPRDIGVTIQEFYDMNDNEQFKNVVSACELLDCIIELYRPGGSRMLPENILSKTRNPFPDDGTPFTALASLIFLLTIILTYKRVVDERVKPVDEETNTIGSSIEDILISSSIKIYDIVEQYKDIAPLPIVPYAVSITLTVFLKYFKLKTAQENWKRGCSILDSMSEYWWTAEAMSSMGNSVFAKLEAEYIENEENRKAIDDLDFSGMLDKTTVNASSFMDQTELFGEFDKDAVDFWFPTPSNDDMDNGLPFGFSRQSVNH